MVNINKLKAKLLIDGHNITWLAENIGMDRSKLYRKLQHDGARLTVKDAQIIADFLKLTSEEIKEIFFAKKVA